MHTFRKFCIAALATALAAAILPPAYAQGAAPYNPLVTQSGWEIGVQASKYKYEEPDFMNLEGNRGGAVAAYTFTNAARVYNRIDLRVSYGRLDYESVGTGTSSDVPDWIGEIRAVLGKDYPRGESVALSPYVGLGYRYLYNDLRGYSSTGAAGYRRYSHYFYAPVGLTVRMRAGGDWVFAPTVEYDAFIGGRQESKLTDTGLGFSDATNRQDHGRGYRAYLMVESRHWAFGPWLHYWKIKDSDIVPIGFGFGGLEPENWTREYGVELRYRF
jgi:hypothetical protein